MLHSNVNVLLLKKEHNTGVGFYANDNGEEVILSKADESSFFINFFIMIKVRRSWFFIKD